MERTKTDRPGRVKPLLFFKEKPELCIASTVIQYLKITAKLRKDTKYLFISINELYKKVTAQTVSRSIKKVL